MLSALTDALPQYDELLMLSEEKVRISRDEADSHRMQTHIEAIYETIFNVLHIAASIFMKPDGS